MLATTILLIASFVQAQRAELAPEPREMELLTAPREMELLAAPREVLQPDANIRLRTSALNRTRIADDFRDLERLNYSLRDLERLNRGYRYTPSYDPFQKSKEEQEKSEKMLRDAKKFNEYYDGMAKQSREQSERKVETFGIVIVLAVIITILRGIYALGAASTKSSSTPTSNGRAYPEWMDEEKDKKEGR